MENALEPTMVWERPVRENTSERERRTAMDRVLGVIVRFPETCPPMLRSRCQAVEEERGWQSEAEEQRRCCLMMWLPKESADDGIPFF